MNAHLPQVIAIVGPTASGKTAFAHVLAKEIGGEILCADARTVYRGMDIGTAKVLGEKGTAEYTGAILHDGIAYWMQDLVSPTQPMTAFAFANAARPIIEKIIARGHVPLIVGGTGLYIDALLRGYTPPPEVDASLMQKLSGQSLDALVSQLTTLDPDAAAVIDLKNPRRVLRALGVRLATGVSFLLQRKTAKVPYRVLWLAPSIERAALDARINERVIAQVHHGLLEEACHLIATHGPDAPGCTAIGYRQVIPYCAGHASKATVISEIQKATRSYARRQMTWFRKNKDIHWVKSTQKAITLVQEFLHLIVR